MKEIVIIFNFLTLIAYSQVSNDVNQYMVFQPFVNSASAASYNDLTVGGYYRNQWVGIDGAPENFGVNAIIPFETLSGVFNVKVFRDKIGANKRDQFSLGYAYRAQLKENTYCAFGLDGVVEIESRDLLGLDVTDVNDVSLAGYQNRMKPNAAFSSYLFNEKGYLGVSFSELIYYNDTESAFSFSKMPLMLHLGKEFKLKNESQSINVSTLLKTSYGTGAHIELNSMFQFLDKKIGIGASYRTSKDIVGILKLAPLKDFTFAYSFQYTLSNLSNYQNGSHELVLVYSLNKAKDIGKLYAPRF